MATPIPAEAQHYPVTNLAGLAEALRRQAAVVDDVADVGNQDLPGFISNGTSNTTVWAAQQLDEAQESLKGEAAENARPKPSLSTVM